MIRRKIQCGLFSFLKKITCLVKYLEFNSSKSLRVIKGHWNVEEKYSDGAVCSNGQKT